MELIVCGPLVTLQWPQHGYWHRRPTRILMPYEMQFRGCHFQCDCMLFVSSVNHDLYLAFIMDTFLVFFYFITFTSYFIPYIFYEVYGDDFECGDNALYKERP
jgi:hypothetical protein